MKTQMFDFLLQVSGYDLLADYPHLHQKAPSGHIVFGRKYADRPGRWERHHAKHFPNSHYNFGPRVATAAWASYYAGTVATAVYLTSLPFMMATATNPQVASKQYQSAITGQPTASDTRLLFGGKQGLSYFKF